MDNWTTKFYDTTTKKVIKTLDGFLKFNENDMVEIEDETYHVSHSYGLINDKDLIVYLEANNDF